VPWTRTKTAKWAFCVTAPNVWNSLPNDICNANSLSTYRAKLKTHFFYCCILVMHTHLRASVLNWHYRHNTDLFYIRLHYTANSHCWFKPDTRHAGPITIDLTERFSAIWAKAVMPFTQICSPTASPFGDLFVIKHYLRNWRHIICIRLLQIRCNCASSEWDILRLCPSDNVCMPSSSYFTAPSWKCDNRPRVWTLCELLLVSSLSHSSAVHSCSEPGEPESNLKILKMIKWEIQISRYILTRLITMLFSSS